MLISRTKRKRPRAAKSSIERTPLEIATAKVKRETNQARQAARRSRLCRALLDRGVRLPEFEHEFYGEKTARPWKFDLAYPDVRLAIEIDGAVFSGGRHVRGDGDRIKYAQAAAYGWRVIPFSTTQIDRQIEECAATIEAAMKWTTVETEGRS